MKKIEFAEAMNPLAAYARELKHEPLALTEGGHAIAALFPIDDDDLESLALSLSPKFQALIDRARAKYRKGASVLADVARREIGIPSVTIEREPQ
jgi:hypothetical protein